MAKVFGEGFEYGEIDTSKYSIRVKPVTTAPKTPKVPQGRDTFQTPNYAVNLLIPFIPKSVRFVWECACGDGKIVHALYASKDRPFVCYQSDIRKSTIILNNISNFLTDEPPMLFTPEDLEWAIITNPPFSIKEEFIEKAFSYKVPFAFLINADYSGKQINWIQRGCEKIIPTRRIDYITPTGRNGKTSSSQFHSMWLTWGFNLGRTETFVDLPIKEKKENI